MEEEAEINIEVEVIIISIRNQGGAFFGELDSGTGLAEGLGNERSNMLRNNNTSRGDDARDGQG